MRNKFDMQEVIAHARERAAELKGSECGEWYEDLTDWLIELDNYSNMREYNRVRYCVKKGPYPMSHYCGYIIFSNIPWLVEECKNITDYDEGCDYINDIVDVYGECTFYNHDTNTLGFDTNHLMDLEKPKSESFVENECRKVIRKLVSMTYDKIYECEKLHTDDNHIMYSFSNCNAISNDIDGLTEYLKESKLFKYINKIYYSTNNNRLIVETNVYNEEDYISQLGKIRKAIADYAIERL